MAKHKMTNAYYSVLQRVRAGESDFGPVSVGDDAHKACIELYGYKFGEPMVLGDNTKSVRGLTTAGERALKAYERQSKAA